MKCSLWAFVLLLTLSVSTVAQVSSVPSLMTFQGRLAKPDGAPVPDTNSQQLTFRLFATAAGGAAVWTQTANNVRVLNGTFAVRFDFTTGFAAGQTLLSAFNGTPYLEVQVGNANPLTPRQPIASNAFAFKANTVPDGSITLAKIASGVLDFSNISGQVTGSQIANGAITNAHLSASLQQSLNKLTFAPVLIGSIGTGVQPVTVAVSGAYAYVVNYSPGSLQIFDVSSPASPILKGSIATGNFCFSVAVSGNYAYVVNAGSNSLQVFNVSNPASPTLAGSVSTGFDPYSVAVSGNFAYVVSQSSDALQIFDVSNPVSPTLKGSIGTGSNPRSVAISGNFAYVVNLFSNTLQIFDVSDSASPTLAGSVGTGSNPFSVAVSGNYAYVVNKSSNSLYIFDVSNPVSPFIRGIIGTGVQPVSVAVSGNFAYVVNYSSNSLQIFDVSNPSNPILKGSIGTGTNPSGVAMSGAYAYVVNQGSNSLQIFDPFGTLQVNGNLAVSANGFFGGNVGIGTNAPTAPLHVATATQQVVQINSSHTGGTWLNLLNSSTGGKNWNLISTGNANGEGAGQLLFRNGTGNFVAMTLIGSTGNVGIGTVTPGYKLDVNGNLHCIGFTNSSDARYKQNVAPFDNALGAILNLRGVTFDWKRGDFPDMNFSDGRQIGFIAQEVEKVLPELVSTDKNGYKSVAYVNIVPILVEAVKTLKADNDRKEDRLKTVEGKLAELKTLLRQLTAQRAAAPRR